MRRLGVVTDLSWADILWELPEFPMANEKTGAHPELLFCHGCARPSG